jgi:hypothetical protein
MGIEYNGIIYSNNIQKEELAKFLLKYKKE